MAPAPVDGCPVYAEFEGGRAGTAHLTWAQHAMWDAIRSHPSAHFNEYLLVAVAHPLELAAAVQAVERLIVRHEALRTHFRAVDDETRQVVVGAGTLGVRVVECRPASAADAESLGARLRAEGFDLDRELPLRVGIVTAGGLVRWIVLAYSHMAADAWAAEILAGDLRRLLEQGTGLEPAGPQPMDLAHEERADEGHATRAAIRHWTEQIRRVSRTTLVPVGPPEDPPYPGATLTSVALRTAARLVAAKCRTSTSTVLLTATAGLLAGYTGNRCVAIPLIASNRFEPRFRRMVGMLVQLGFFVLDLPERATLYGILPAASRAAVRAYARASYDQAALDAALIEVMEQRGTPIDWLSCVFNDGRLTIDPAGDHGGAGGAGDGPGRANLPRMLSRTRLTWHRGPAWMRGRFSLAVRECPDGLQLRLTADSRCLPARQVERFLRGVEQLVVAAALDDVRVGEWPPYAAAGISRAAPPG